MYELKKNVIQQLKTFDKKKTLMKNSNQKHDNRLISTKNLMIAEKAKQDGNSKFCNDDHNFKVHHDILCDFNKSIVYSLNDSEGLASAYANKSALLRHVRKYEESICESDKALKITESVTLKLKLLCRKAECYTALGSSENRACLRKARFLLTKIDKNEKMGKMLNSLVLKTQSIVDEGQLDTPKEVKRRTQGTKLVSDAEKVNVWDSVTVKYSERYGKHLVAARDFEPGEIIFVERPYINVVPDHKAFVYCYHCLKYLWTIVPCDHCAWRAFCSAKCKEEAFNQYHGKECSVFMHMKETVSFEEYHLVSTIMSIFFKTLNEAGGDIHQLQKELESIDERQDGLSPDKQIANFKNIFSLPNQLQARDHVDFCFKNAAVALLGLARFTKIFGTTYDYSKINELMKNETAIFVGALLAKYALILSGRCSQIKPFDPEEKPDKFDLGLSYQVKCRSTGPGPLMALSVLSQFTILNCIPNVMKVHTHDNKFIAFAVHPIKKGEQLTSSIMPMYLRKPKSERQRLYRDMHNRPCDCQACTENWYEDPETNGSNGLIWYPDSEGLSVTEIGTEARLLTDEFDRNKCKLNHPDLKLLTSVAKLVGKAWAHYPLPSAISGNSISLLMEVSNHFYRAVEEHLEFSETCQKKPKVKNA